MPLSSAQKRQLRSLAHHLKPVVMVGQNGLHEGVVEETRVALAAHELIKVKIAAADRDDLKETVASLADQTSAELVQLIGHTAIYYRANPELKQPISI